MTLLRWVLLVLFWAPYVQAKALYIIIHIIHTMFDRQQYCDCVRVRTV